MAQRWSLYIDESGEFGDGYSLVGGLLLRCSAEALLLSPLEARLGEIFGPGPWPPHAAVERMPASFVLRAEWGREGMTAGRIGREVRQLCRDVARHTEAAAPPNVRAALGEVRAGGAVNYDRTSKLDSWLRAGAGGLENRWGATATFYRQLTAARDRRANEMNALVEGVVKRVGDGGSWVATVAAPGPGPGGLAPGSAELERDSYVDALACLLRRVALVMPGAEIDLLVLTRHVSVVGLPRVGMQSRWIRQLAEHASRGLSRPPRFRVVGGRHLYGARRRPEAPMHPALALADWIVNGIRRATQRSAGHSWAQLLPLLEAGAGVGVPEGVLRRVEAERGAWDLPTLCAAGPAHDRLEALIAGASAIPAAPSGWMGEQSERMGAAAHEGAWR